MASPQAAAIDRLYEYFLTTFAAKPDMGVDEMRDLFEHWCDVGRDPGGVDYMEVDAGGTPCFWAVPKGAALDRVLIALHGGGCVNGSRFSHRKLYGTIAKAVGCRALIVDYKRAPEHPFPSQVNECLAAYQWVLAQGVSPKHVATIGDSAGGLLATTTVLAARDRGVPLPAAVVPLSPWYDMEAVGESYRTNAGKDKLISADLIRAIAGMALGSASPRDPLANPLFADFRGLPPMYIQVGGYEALLDDALRAEKLARAAGVEVKVDVFPEMQHVFQFMAGYAPEADDAVVRIAAWLRPRLGLVR